MRRRRDRIVIAAGLGAIIAMLSVFPAFWLLYAAGFVAAYGVIETIAGEM